MRTPRDTLRLNQEDGMQLISQTPRDLRLRDQAMRGDLRSRLASLPKPKETDFELELPEEQQEQVAMTELSEEDAAARDRRAQEVREAAARADLRRQSQVVQRGLPRPAVVDYDAMMANAAGLHDAVKRAIAEEMATLIANDAVKFGGAKVSGAHKTMEVFDDDAIGRAKMEIALEVSKDEQGRRLLTEQFGAEWEALHTKSILPGLAGYGEDEIDEQQLLTEAFDVSSHPTNATIVHKPFY